MIKNTELLANGFIQTTFPLSKEVLSWVKAKEWSALDHHFLEISKKDGSLHSFLSQFLDFQTLEHIIAIRTAPIDEDGIWHDDGSRFMGFSLSLNLEPQSISGGELLFKLKGNAPTKIFSPLDYGQIVLFLSGIYGYEHKVNAVTNGERIVIAGWCS